MLNNPLTEEKRIELCHILADIFTPKEWDILGAMAEQELRPIELQLVYIVRKYLEDSGALERMR